MVLPHGGIHGVRWVDFGSWLMRLLTSGRARAFDMRASIWSGLHSRGINDKWLPLRECRMEGGGRWAGLTGRQLLCVGWQLQLHAMSPPWQGSEGTDCPARCGPARTTPNHPSSHVALSGYQVGKRFVQDVSKEPQQEEEAADVQRKVCR